MPDWVSWDEALAVVARHFPPERAEDLLKAAIMRGAIEVRVSDRGYATHSPRMGRDVVGNPDYPYGVGEARPYFRIEDVEFQSLKDWLSGLTFGPAPAPKPTTIAADQLDEGHWSAEPQVRETAQSDSEVAKLAAADAKSPRRRGPKPVRREAVIAAMRKFPFPDLCRMTEEAMAAQFEASRDTCRRALKEIHKNSDN